MTRRRHVRRPRAFTIPEMLVVAFLGMVVLFLIAQILVPSLLLFRLESARSEVQQTSQVFIQRLQRELLNTTFESVTVLSEPPAVSFQEVPDQDSFDLSTGRPRLSPYFVIYYYDRPKRRILSKRWPPAPPDLTGYHFLDPYEPKVLTPPHLRSILVETNGTERVVAHNVEDLVLTDDDGDGSILHPPLVATITCQADASGGGHDRKETFQMSARILCRNGRW